MLRSILDTKLTNFISQSPLHYSCLVGCSQKYRCSFSHMIVEWTLTVGNCDMVRAGARLLSVWLRYCLESQWTPPPPPPRVIVLGLRLESRGSLPLFLPILFHPSLRPAGGFADLHLAVCWVYCTVFVRIC